MYEKFLLTECSFSQYIDFDKRLKIARRRLTFRDFGFDEIRDTAIWLLEYDVH